MSSREPLAVRLYGFSLRVMLSSLGEDYRAEAVATFADLREEAGRAGMGGSWAFYGREIRSLLGTIARSRKEARGRKNGQGKKEGGPWGPLDTLRQDLRYALRTLSRSPGFVAVTILSLTFAIAVSTLVFSVANAGLFRPVPYVADQDALVRVFTSNQRNHGRGPNSFPDFQDYRDLSETLEDLAAIGSKRFSVGIASQGTRPIWGLEVSENYFQLLGIPLARGRGFLPEDVENGGRVVVIGNNTWRREFDSDPDVLGKTLHLNGLPYAVVGVGPEGMVALDGPALVEIAVPIIDFRDRRGRMALQVVGRLKPGSTLPQAQAEFDAIAEHLVETYPEMWNYEGRGARSLRVLPNQEARIPEGAPLLAIFGGIGAVVALIMLIACSNVANLLLTRGFRRRTEIAIRSAIGAPARRVFSQLLTENLLLFGAAGGIGLLVAQWAASVLGSGWALIPPPGAQVSVDARVAFFTLALTLGTGLTFGLIPALQASRPDLIPALKGLAPRIRFRFLGMRNLLVGAQVGGSLIMVMSTLLLVQSLSYARTIDLGFDPAGVATLSLDLSHLGLGDEEGARFYQDLLERTARLPGVDAVGLASWIPLEGGSTSQGDIRPEGYEPGPQEYLMAGVAAITPGYLELTRMHLLRGRDFGPEDRPGSPEVAMVNQAFVDRFWPGEDGVGKWIGTGKERGYRVVGVVADVPYRDLASEPGPFMWLPLEQNYQPDLMLHARTAGDPRALLPLMRRQVGEMNPNLPVVRADLMENISANATQPQRILSAVLGATGLLTLALAMLGIYGVVAYSVGQRTREMGLRMALGAEPMRVVGLVLREGLVLSLIGLVPGLLGAVGASRLMRALLLGLDPMDPLAFGGGVGILLAAVMAASLAPAIRASRAHPMESFRTE